MNTGKKDFYDLLSTTEYTVYQKRPEIITELPVIVFSLGEALSEYTLHEGIGSQLNVFDVDLFTENSEEASDIMLELEELFLNEYLIGRVVDIPESENCHLNFTVRTII